MKIDLDQDIKRLESESVEDRILDERILCNSESISEYEELLTNEADKSFIIDDED